MGIKQPFWEKRLSALRQRMEQSGIELAIIMKPENVFYYSGFNPILNSHKTFVLVPLEGEPILLVHSLRGDHAREESWLSRIVYHGKWGNKQPVDLDPYRAVAAIAGDGGQTAHTVGLELSFLPYNIVHALLEKLGQPRVRDLSDYYNKTRLVKDEEEISRIRGAAALADCAMDRMIEVLRAGGTEAEACTEGQYAMRRLWQTKYAEHEISGFGGQEGGIIDALNCWVLTDRRIAYGCDCPTSRKPAEGELVLPMVWAKWGGYHAENERTLLVSELDNQKQRAYHAMLRARKQIFRIIRPGVTFEDLYLEAAHVFENEQFGHLIPGRVGHGIGLAAHEYPSLEQGNEILLEPGMVFTVEPGLMSTEWGGARHADTVLVTEDGYELLTLTERDTLII